MEDALELVEPAAAWKEVFLEMARDFQASGEDRLEKAIHDLEGFLSEVLDAPRPDQSGRTDALEREVGWDLVGGEATAVFGDFERLRALYLIPTLLAVAGD